MRSNGDERVGHAIVGVAGARRVRSARRRQRFAIATVALTALAGLIHAASAASVDPPSSYAGRHLTAREAAHYAYDAGFRTEGSLLAVVAIGIAESGLVTGARNWHPEFGYRPASAVIGVRGPASVWSGGRQMNSDRGTWQISSRSWSRYSDAQTDNPATAAKIMFSISHHGSDFSPWDTYTSGDAQQYFDGARDGWPALRPIVRAVLASGRQSPTTAPPPSATPRSEVRMSGTYTTAYDWYDNNPPGSAAISNPVIHQRAGGTGTYADPLTVAVDHLAGGRLQFAPGTRFYVPNLRAYLIAEDTTGETAPRRVHLDIWAGGRTSTKSSAYNCMSHVTGDYLVIRNPARNYAVVRGPLSAHNTCRRLYGNRVVRHKASSQRS